jgi:hypothetical protein
MYKHSNFPLIINAFVAEYMKNTPTRQDYAHTLFSQRILKDAVAFVNANHRYFAKVPTPMPKTEEIAQEPVEIAQEPKEIAQEPEEIAQEPKEIAQDPEEIAEEAITMSIIE